MDIRRGDHVSLMLPDIAASGFADTFRSNRRSWFRLWNQCTRLQRSLTLMVAIVLITATFMLIVSTDTWAQLTQPNAAIRVPAGVELPNVAERPLGEVQIAPYRIEAPANRKPSAPPVVDNSQPEAGDGVGAAPPDVRPEPQQQNVVDAPDVPQKVHHSIAFKGAQNERQHAVVKAFRHAWAGYKEFAWGHDNLKPISMSSHDWFGLGLTLVDSLDTMFIMDLQEEFDEARDWVDQHLHFDANREVNLFEVTIRVLGGLLSAHHLSGDRMFLDKAIDLGTRMLPCFDSPSGIPFSDVNLGTMNAHAPKWSPDSSTSEVTTIQLEFRDLARSSGDQRFATVVERINDIVHGLDKPNGLVPIFINANTGTFRSFSTVSLGARGDSYYEYLLKQWLQSGHRPKDQFLLDDYRRSMDGVQAQLVRTTPREHHVYVGELINGKDFKPKMDHLTCYLPGTLLLGNAHAGQPAEHRRLADDLMETCYQTYMKQPTQLAPEITYFNVASESESDLYVKSNDAHNLLRPEFVESLYYFYALTGNRTYQDMGWTIFQAFEKHTRVRSGYTSIGNVKSVLNTRPRDMMESFFLGETLKYFYLLFSDDRHEIDLQKFVFNSEAHLVPIWPAGETKP